MSTTVIVDWAPRAKVYLTKVHRERATLGATSQFEDERIIAGLLAQLEATQKKLKGAEGFKRAIEEAVLEVGYYKP